ncbi:MAG: type II/IV secretion system ATPase subunit, partial [Candidatus Geothermarchaeales archaeon]
IEDISCDGEAIPLYVWHKFYENLQTSVSLTKEELDSVILRLAYRTGYQVTVSNPILDGDLPDGSRAHIALGEVSKRGGSFTIRKFSEKPFTVVDLINFGTISAEVAAYFWIMIENFRSMMISGATASGKTTLLNAIAMFIFPESKICTIEETREIRLPHENWVPLVSRQVFHEGIREITLFDLLKSSLRQRPDYIVVGEVRGQEAYTFFQAIGTGHGGLCTIHSDSIETSVKRLLTKPMDVPLMLMPLMQVGVHISRVRVRGETTRRVVEIKETIGIDEETEKVEFNPTFNWGGEDNDSFLFSGRSIVFERMAEQNFIPVENYYGELEDRAELLRWMALRKRMTYNEIAETIRRFYYDKDGVMQEVRLGEG